MFFLLHQIIFVPHHLLNVTHSICELVEVLIQFVFAITVIIGHMQIRTKDIIIFIYKS